MFRFPCRPSGFVAKDRLKLLLTSERLECSPQMMTMLQNDLIRAVKILKIHLRACYFRDDERKL